MRGETHNRELKRFGRSGGRWKRSLKMKRKTPNNWILLRPFKASVVSVFVMMAHSGVTQPDIWRFVLEESNQKIGFSIHSEVELPNWLEVFRASGVHFASNWATFEVVEIEIALLKWAVDVFENAKSFFIVSGDSIPIKSPLDIINFPFSDIVYSYRAEESEKRGCLEFFNSTWKVLSRDTALKLIECFFSNKVLLKDTQTNRLKEFNQCVTAPDEWVIGTCLYGKFPFISLNTESTNLLECMDMEWEESIRDCGCSVNHARLFKNFDELTYRIEKRLDEQKGEYIAFRKVSSCISSKRLLRWYQSKVCKLSPEDFFIRDMWPDCI